MRYFYSAEFAAEGIRTLGQLTKGEKSVVPGVENSNGTRKGERYQCFRCLLSYSKESMAQEALKTQIDSLQWEVNRLDTENQKLRGFNPERSQFVELESELSLAKEDITNLNAELDSQRQQLTERDLRITESDRKLTEAERVIEELRASASQLEEASNEAEQRRSEVEAELVTMNYQISHLSETCAMLQQENQQLTRDGDLRRYQAVEEERRKWEARESRLVTEIVELKRQLKAREATQVQGGVSITCQ